ncbi:MAG TPA: lipid II flippase MurJ, partial [Acidimicrobiales bacterium]|nr:lipid II flippase MurJ [Acidimicrobiales bacterium]
MTVLTAVSRATGFLRILVVAAVLGTTFLGNVYQSANTVPNLLFELVAAGALQAVLVPTVVGLLDAGDRRQAEHVAGAVLGLAAAALAALAVVGALAAPWIMRALVVAVDDPSVREAQVRLGTFFLWFFLPQVVLYALGMVSTAVLHAHGRFAVPAAAPIVNNAVVIGTYVLFAALRAGEPPDLDLAWEEKVVLAGGTTLGVAAFCVVPWLATRSLGFSLVPRFDPHHPAVRRIGRLAGWAAVSLAMVQVLLGTALVLGNGVEGGVVAFQVGLTFFLLPYALVAVPLATAAFPGLSRLAHADDG